MKQAYLPKPDTILYRDVETPTPGADEVLIRVSRIGICGSDLHVFKGKHPLVEFPLVQGHEFSGFVEEVGKDVSGLAPNDLVTVQPAVGCGVCDRCREGFIARCDDLLFIGGALPGAGSEYLSVPARHVVRMPEGISPDQAAMTEPLAVAVHGVGHPPSLTDQDVLIVGGGTIGNLIAQAARLFGPRRLVVAERVAFRRKILEDLSIDVIEPRSSSPIEEQVKGLFERCPDVSFECAGTASALNACIRATRRGGDVVVLGVYGDDPTTEMVLVQDKELTLTGSLMYTWDDFYGAVDLMEKRRVSLEPLITHHVPFDNWIEGYRLLMRHTDETLKVIVDL
ncbi:MAG: alcohol dehydrogenase catalytic domain-containing protein [Deltaproteobacteria bacterium]|nr:alcohol dehydrogenase catalytic domain-containing protein [Candidatus Zymogenaceae bacterium]